MLLHPAYVYLYLVIGFASAPASVLAVPQRTANVTSVLFSKHPTDTLRIKDDMYGIRNVAYYVTPDNQAIIDGDVVYPGGLTNLRAHSYTTEDDESVDPRSFSVFRGAQSWPNATILYKFADNTTQTMLSNLVNSAINRWLAKAPYLIFQQLPNNAPDQGSVTITARPCSGCYASVGYLGASRGHFLNLEQSCGGLPFGCGVAEATHEFGHVLGLLHEHQRPDRELTVHYNCQNLDPMCFNIPPGATCCGNLIPGCCEAASNFDTPAGVNDFSGLYDTNSIMHYPSDAFALPGKLTMTPAVPGVVVPVTNVEQPSDLDFGRICKIYKPAGPC